MKGIDSGFVLGGRYQVVKSLGAGGMGAVYLASDTQRQGLQVALKVLYPGVIRTPEVRERFHNEIQASYRVDHPNIVRSYEHFDEDDFQAYAMEYVDGGDLFAKIRCGPMTADEVVAILRQCAAGLAAVHAQGIVHRDLKPENILLSRDGGVKIADFGVARLKGASNITQVGAMVGTPKYLAPEYVETGECDARGDIYALGVIGYEMVSGLSPFQADSRVSLMVERLKYEVEPLRKVAPHCTAALAYVIERAMEVNVHRRYQSAQEMELDLQRIEAGELPLGLQQRGSRAGLRALFVGLARRTPAAESDHGRAETELLERPNPGSVGSRSFRIWAGASGAALALGLLALIGVSGLLGRADLADLPQGSYRGMVSGLLADNNALGLRIWKTEAGAFVLLGLERCYVAKLSKDGAFNCGDLSFKLELESFKSGTVTGTITEHGWGPTARWNAVVFDGGEL